MESAFPGCASGNYPRGTPGWGELNVNRRDPAVEVTVQRDLSDAAGSEVQTQSHVSCLLIFRSRAALEVDVAVVVDPDTEPTPQRSRQSMSWCGWLFESCFGGCGVCDRVANRLSDVWLERRPGFKEKSCRGDAAYCAKIAVTYRSKRKPRGVVVFPTREAAVIPGKIPEPTWKADGNRSQD